MRQRVTVKHEFVESLPDALKEGTLYVCMEFATAAHKCCCGCGKEVVTPLSPTDWKLMYDGRTITLHPSIGNWGFACRSHYWIRGDRIEWAPSWSDAEVRGGRERDRVAKDWYFDSFGERSEHEPGHKFSPVGATSSVKPTILKRVARWWQGP
jgi:hypothetical protein